MDYTDYLIYKLIAVGLLAFVWGIYCGATGRELSGQPQRRAPRAKAPAETQD